MAEEAPPSEPPTGFFGKAKLAALAVGEKTKAAASVVGEKAKEIDEKHQISESTKSGVKKGGDMVSSLWKPKADAETTEAGADAEPAAEELETKVTPDAPSKDGE
eukprot:scaffold95666_cov42-Attheya_sp.AAC.1